MSRQLAIMNWSGGKDSALALYHGIKSEQWNIQALLTSVNDLHGRISMHGVRIELLNMQAERLGLPLQLLRLSGDVSMEDYNAKMYETLQPFQEQGVSHAIFGDIFLEDLRHYREAQLQAVNLIGEFPLWQRNTTELVREFVDLGFRAVLVCVNEKQLPADFVGRELDLDLLKDLPKNVDPCGENGEYHSFVYDGPIFSSPIPIVKGDVVRRTYTPSSGTHSNSTNADSGWDTGFWYQDLLLKEQLTSPPTERRPSSKTEERRIMRKENAGCVNANWPSSILFFGSKAVCFQTSFYCQLLSVFCIL